MEEQCELIKAEPKNMLVPICIAQFFCITVILISVLIIKLFFKESYYKLQKWCVDNLFYHTTITAFDEENSEI